MGFHSTVVRSATSREPQAADVRGKAASAPAAEMLGASPRATQFKALAAMINGSARMATQARRLPAPGGAPVLQRLIDAGAAPGVDLILPGVAATLNDAARASAVAINHRARGGGAHQVAPLGAHHAGNLYLRANYLAGHLETWIEMSAVGGGYVKRVRIVEGAATIIDRVMNELPGTALQQALAANRHPGGALAGGERYDSVHAVHGEDAGGLRISGDSERSADNLTKMVGEGARFAWLSRRLASHNVGNASVNVFKVQINLPQAGTLTMDPTFHQLWGAWDSAFGRSYMKNIGAAKVLLKQRLAAGWRVPVDADQPGAAALASGAKAAGQVTSLLHKSGTIALMPAGGVDGPAIVADLRMTWVSDH